MKNKLVLFFFFLFITLSLSTQAADFTLTSPDLKDGGTLGEKFILNGFGCSGKNFSPALFWKNAPAETKSFAITMYDPDAPTGSGWWHWTIFNLPATTSKLKSAESGKLALPATALEGRTDFGKPGYGGACPPPGDKPHRYIFTIYALKTEKLDLNADASAAMLGFFLHQNTLAKASLTVSYGR